jgi:glycosyltransferase involved in cell wall biosynthesis
MDKRVLHICPSLGSGGIEKLIVQWCELAEQCGIRFVFAVYRKGGATYDYFIEKGYSIYELKRLKDIGKKAYTRQIKEIAEKERINIVHINAGTLSGFTLRAAKDAGIQSRIVHAHTNKYNLPKNRFLASFLLWYARKLNNLYSTIRLGCSREAASYCFGPKSSFRVIHNGIDLTAFRFKNAIRESVRNELGFSSERKIVGFVGRLSEQKNPMRLLDIYNAFKHKEPNSALLIVGDGELREEMQRKIKLQNVEDVIFVGAKQNVAPYYAAMDVIVMPSLYEGLLIVAVEAQAMGTPIIISENVPKEVIITENVKQEFLDSPLEKWVDSMIKMSSRPRVDYRKVLSEKGYDVAQTTKEMVSIYENELKRIAAK